MYVKIAINLNLHPKLAYLNLHIIFRVYSFKLQGDLLFRKIIEKLSDVPIKCKHYALTDYRVPIIKKFYILTSNVSKVCAPNSH